MAKPVKSELQKAADAVRVMQSAVENSEKAVKVCEANVEKAKKKYSEDLMNLADTQSLLRAQREKLNREIGRVYEIINGQGVSMCETVRSY